MVFFFSQTFFFISDPLHIQWLCCWLLCYNLKAVSKYVLSEDGNNWECESIYLFHFSHDSLVGYHHHSFDINKIIIFSAHVSVSCPFDSHPIYFHLFYPKIFFFLRYLIVHRNRHKLCVIWSTIERKMPRWNFSHCDQRKFFWVTGWFGNKNTFRLFLHFIIHIYHPHCHMRYFQWFKLRKS